MSLQCWLTVVAAIRFSLHGPVMVAAIVLAPPLALVMVAATRFSHGPVMVAAIVLAPLAPVMVAAMRLCPLGPVMVVAIRFSLGPSSPLPLPAEVGGKPLGRNAPSHRAAVYGADLTFAGGSHRGRDGKLRDRPAGWAARSLRALTARSRPP